jgi:LacI family transcriptional regulator
MGQSKKVIVMLDPLKTFTPGLLRGLGKYVRTNNEPWAFFRVSNYRQALRSTSLKRMVQRIGADGVVVREHEDIDVVLRMGVPVVTMNYRGRGRAGVANLTGDMAAIGCMGAEHLLDRGFRQFAYLGYEDREWSTRRQRSFAARLRQAGHTVHAYVTAESTDIDEWFVEIDKITSWLKSMPKPLGVMACNDERGVQIIEACRMAGLRVPDDVAVLGVDNNPAVCNFSNPRLSSIALNVEDAGYTAAETLNGWMAGGKRSHVAVMIRPVRVVTRESTDVVATVDKDVSSAVRFIRDHASRAIQVSEVVDHVGTSRRRLETRFRAVLGASLLERIRSARVERAIMLLTDGDLAVSEIARLLGYPGAPQFSRYFKRGTGVSPGEYRHRYGVR